VAPNGTSGGTVTTAGNIPTAYSSVPFLIDMRGFLGTDSSYAAAVSLKLLSTLSTLLGSATNLFAGSRQVMLDKVASTAIGRIAFAIAGRTWGDIAQQRTTYTPAGGQAASIETLAVRAFSDGTTPTDALLFDLSNGTGDLRAGSATMVAAATLDLSSAPTKKVAVAGATGITSFGPGRHLERLLHFVDGGNTLTHNATSLILPGGANIVTRAGDTLHATSDGSGNWRVRSYDRASGTPLVVPFRGAPYATLATNQYVAATDNGRAFSWTLASGAVGLPLGSTVFPGWSCQIRFLGAPVGYAASTVIIQGFADAFLFNGRAQFINAANTLRGFVVIGGGEEFRFTWTGTEWVVETIQSPPPGFFLYTSFGSGGMPRRRRRPPSSPRPVRAGATLREPLPTASACTHRATVSTDFTLGQGSSTTRPAALTRAPSRFPRPRSPSPTCTTASPTAAIRPANTRTQCAARPSACCSDRWLQLTRSLTTAASSRRAILKSS
jgi:hypothetical protein